MEVQHVSSNPGYPEVVFRNDTLRFSVEEKSYDEVVFFIMSRSQDGFLSRFAVSTEEFKTIRDTIGSFMLKDEEEARARAGECGACDHCTGGGHGL